MCGWAGALMLTDHPPFLQAHPLSKRLKHMCSTALTSMLSVGYQSGLQWSSVLPCTPVALTLLTQSCSLLLARVAELKSSSFSPTRKNGKKFLSWAISLFLFSGFSFPFARSHVGFVSHLLLGPTLNLTSAIYLLSSTFFFFLLTWADARS